MVKRSNQIRAHRAHLSKLLRRYRITIRAARDIVWTDDRIGYLQERIDAGFDEWSKDDWPHAVLRGCPRSGHTTILVTPA